MSFKTQASKGVLWVAVERFGQQLFQVIIFIILARLLSPEDFGLIAMLIIFFEISRSFVESGMGQALIREKEITDQDRATVFWLNLLLSFIIYFLLYVSAPYIALFYERPELTNLTRVMGLAVIFQGIAIVQSSELTQNLEFKKQAIAHVPALFIAGVVSIAMAYLGYGVWALAVKYLLVAFCSSILLWIVQPARIVLQWNRESFNRLFGFGYKLLLSGLLDSTYQNIYKLVIGKFFAASTLGFYTIAKNLQNMASQNLVGIIQKVTYPLLSKMQGDTQRMKRGYRKVIQSSSFVIFPGIILLIIFAEPIMVYALGEQWLPAAPFLQILCLSSMFYHLSAINLNVLKVLGRSDLFLKMEIIKKVNITIAIIVGLQFGIYGLLVGQLISSYIALLINIYYSAKFLNYSIFNQAKDVLKVLMLALPMVMIAGGMLLIVPVNSLAVLLLFLIGSGAVYLTSNLLYRTEITNNVLKMVSPWIPGKLKTFLHI